MNGGPSVRGFAWDAAGVSQGSHRREPVELHLVPCDDLPEVLHDDSGIELLQHGGKVYHDGSRREFPMVRFVQRWGVAKR